MSYWITSDTHFGHKNITGPKLSRWADGYRIFDSIQEMDDCMLGHLNKLVQPSDTLIHLGDFAFGDEDNYQYYCNRINCKNIQFIVGNHDKIPMRKLDTMFNRCSYYDELKYYSDKIVLSHYAMMTWNKSHRGSFMLHGHSHGSLQYPFKQRIKDVGVDTNDFKPYLLEDVIKELSLIEPFSPDHHKGRE